MEVFNIPSNFRDVAKWLKVIQKRNLGKEIGLIIHDMFKLFLILCGLGLLGAFFGVA
tara:strand:+ start:720 stop:890 length:171 start_codon:yes stop_codon:yes gene_type:complete